MSLWFLFLAMMGPWHEDTHVQDPFLPLTKRVVSMRVTQEILESLRSERSTPSYMEAAYQMPVCCWISGTRKKPKRIDGHSIGTSALSGV
jgi:hypothetical protein